MEIFYLEELWSRIHNVMVRLNWDHGSGSFKSSVVGKKAKAPDSPPPRKTHWGDFCYFIALSHDLQEYNLKIMIYKAFFCTAGLYNKKCFKQTEPLAYLRNWETSIRGEHYQWSSLSIDTQFSHLTLPVSGNHQLSTPLYTDKPLEACVNKTSQRHFHPKDAKDNFETIGRIFFYHFAYKVFLAYNNVIIML